MIEQVTLNESSLILKNILQDTKTLQPFTINFKTEITYKSYLKCQAERLGLRGLRVGGA